MISFRSVDKDSVEHSELMSAVIVPEWALNSLIFKDEEVAQSQFENYYADKNQDLPKDKWQTPVKLTFDYCSYDYEILGPSSDLQNFQQSYIDRDEAIEKCIACLEELDKLNDNSEE